jgi:hypothetical protein
MSHSMELMLGPVTNVALQITIRRPEAGDFNAGLLPVQSPLLRQSQLISFPPLTDMLKFSG